MNDLPLVVFVRGCARSGTTLLADIMNESPKIGLLVEQPLGDLAARMLDIFWFEDHILETRAIIAEKRRAAEKVRGAGEHFVLVENLDRMRFPRRYPTRENSARSSPASSKPHSRNPISPSSDPRRRDIGIASNSISCVRRSRA